MDRLDIHATLLWDGSCDFCRWCVRWVESHDARKRIKAIPYQEVSSPIMTDSFRAQCARSVQLLLPGSPPLSGGRAVLAVFSMLGWRKTAAFLSTPPLIWVIQAGYWVTARYRGALGRLLNGKEHSR